MKILNILSDKIEMESLFIPDMCDLLQLYSYPFFKERSSDEFNFSAAISDCMANLGEKRIFNFTCLWKFSNIFCQLIRIFATNG